LRAGPAGSQTRLGSPGVRALRTAVPVPPTVSVLATPGGDEPGAGSPRWQPQVSEPGPAGRPASRGSRSHLTPAHCPARTVPWGGRGAPRRYAAGDAPRAPLIGKCRARRFRQYPPYQTVFVDSSTAIAPRLPWVPPQENAPGG